MNEEAIKKLDEEYKTNKAELESSYNKQVNDIKIERKREEKEYNYNTKREREVNNISG